MSGEAPSGMEFRVGDWASSETHLKSPNALHTDTAWR